MPRGTAIYNEAVDKDELAPILLVRFLDMPNIETGELDSLYVTDYMETGVQTINFFDEDGNACEYVCLNVSYDQIEMSGDSSIPEVEITIDNVTREFSSLAQYYELNGVEVHLLSATRETLTDPLGAVMKFAGFINEARISEYSIKVRVKPGYSLFSLAPKWLYHPRYFPYLPASKDVRRVLR